jgi:hypothetical protein
MAKWIAHSLVDREDPGSTPADGKLFSINCMSLSFSVFGVYILVFSSRLNGFSDVVPEERKR